MKTRIPLLLALFLMTALLTGCGENNTTVITTTIASDETTTTTEATTTTTKATTTTTTTLKPTGTVYIVDPKNYKDNYYYVGALQPDSNGLVRPRILFEGEYAVVMHYTYSAVKEDDDQQPFEYQGKTYYGQGEGMSPYQFEVTAREIVVKDQNNNNAVIMKLVLRSDGTMFVTHTTDHYFPNGLILTPVAQ